jgi:hypothetical protein
MPHNGEPIGGTIHSVEKYRNTDVKRQAEINESNIDALRQGIILSTKQRFHHLAV